MIGIIAHRGFWKVASEKNSKLAFVRALEQGFGIETDFRDLNGRLVVSHDMPVDGVMTAEEFGDICRATPVNAPMALNIKADGLHPLVSKMVRSSSIKNYFVFDMSVPDMRGYFSLNIPTFTRISEYEQSPSFLERAEGLWVDSFEKQWFDISLVEHYLRLNKSISFVSPELHGRSHKEFWLFLKSNNLHKNALISLCTDFPLDARNFFHG